MKAFKKIDKFYFLMALVLTIVAVLVVYTFRGVFSAITLANDVETEIPDTELRIDKTKLDAAHDVAFNKEIVKLEIR